MGNPPIEEGEPTYTTEILAKICKAKNDAAADAQLVAQAEKDAENIQGRALDDMMNGVLSTKKDMLGDDALVRDLPAYAAAPPCEARALIAERRRSRPAPLAGAAARICD